MTKYYRPQKTAIEWCDYTFNANHGCSHVSPGCDHCYAERLACSRLAGIGNYPKDDPFRVVWNYEKLEHARMPNEPSRIFYSSMGDLFHEQIPDDFIFASFEMFRRFPEQTFYVLTKRPERALNIEAQLARLKNVWLGVSVESNDCLFRIEMLRKIKNINRFVSFEPLIEDLSLINTCYYSLNDIHWVIVGGESGKEARAMQPIWIRHLKNACWLYDIPFFFKGWGQNIPYGQEKGKLDGQEYHNWPKDGKR